MNKKNVLWICVVLTLSVCVAAAQAAAPKRPMLEQGKMWTYIYHHVEAYSEPPIDEPMWEVYYRLKGDTIIDGRQYMKMYRSDWNSSQEEYYGAFREDREGRVYHYNRYNDKQDFKMFDPNSGSINENPNESVIVETIKSNGSLFNRYRYWIFSPDYGLVESNRGVEGVGYRFYGIIHTSWERIDCPEDYEELYSVSCKDFNFSASDFDAPKEIELAEGEQELINSNNDFAFNLFRKARGDKSKILSPLSITFAEAGADAINAFSQKMLKESNTLDEKTKALIANTIFVNEGCGYRLQEGFIDKANTFYDAQPQNRDFNDGETMNVINQWASDHTEGMIPTVLDTLTYRPDNVSYLLNALYFKGIWSSPFRKENTQDEPFGGGDDVPMMHQEKSVKYAENDFYQAVRLPYGNGAYRMDIFLPREDKTVGEVLESLNGSNWQPKYEYRSVDLKLPRFETDTNQGLIEIMSDLGMPSAFSVFNAEFPYFCNVPIFISQMFQVAKIKLDEEGTEAAAVTVIGEATSGMPPVPKPFHANRPFLYIISEQSTGAIFFIGQYTGGVTADIRTGIVATKADPKLAGNNQPYNLAGQKVNASYKGIVIQNGKKYIIK